jgi:DNA-binding protein YbaB
MALTIAERLTSEEDLVTIRKNGATRAEADPELAGALRRAFALWARLGELEAELSEIKEEIARRAEEVSGPSGGGGATVTFEAGGAACTVSMRHEALVPQENVPALRRLLGRRFRDLVRTKVRHTATSRLVREAGEEALSLIKLRRLSPQFRWRALPEGDSECGKDECAARGRAR